MLKIAVLTANLGGFDNTVLPVDQSVPYDYHIFDDDNFPPIAGLTPRLQYRLPKLFGWEMYPGYDIYIWLDGSMSLQRKDSVEWMLRQLSDKDAAFFKHPDRSTVKEEVDYIEKKLQEGNRYITSRYKNGLHKENYKEMSKHKAWKDDTLLASTSFIYRNNNAVQSVLRAWWFYQSRYFSCDQIPLPFVIKQYELNIKVIQDNIFKNPYVSLVSHHK